MLVSRDDCEVSRSEARAYVRDMRDMVMDMGGYEMLGYGRGRPVPCRVFLQPDDKGRMEIIAEPYSHKEIEENQLLRGVRALWAEWNVAKTNAILAWQPWKDVKPLSA